MDELTSEQTLATEQNGPTNEESLEKAIAEIDLGFTRADYLATYFRGFINRVRCLFSPWLLKQKKIRLLQLAFLEQVKELAKDVPVKDRAYILLGAFQYARGRWLPFPNSGPLFELELKRSDLVQVISENDERIKLEILFNNPMLINKEADKQFIRFLEKNPELHYLEME